MVGVPFNFGRAPLMTLDEQTHGIGSKRHGRRIKPGLSLNQAIRLLDVGNDILFRRATASGQTSQRQRGSHELQEIAAVHRIVPFRGRLAGKFAVEQVFKARIARQFF